MNQEQKINHQWEVLNHINELIQSADSKAEISLAIVGIVAGFLFTSGFELVRSPGYTSFAQDSGLLALFFLIAGIVALACSSACAFLCLTARTGSHRWFKKLIEPTISRPDSTLIFFGRVLQYKREDYVSAISKTSETDILIDLAEQTHVLSCIAGQKYRWLNKVYLSLAISLISFLLLSVTTFR